MTLVVGNLVEIVAQVAGVEGALLRNIAGEVAEGLCGLGLLAGKDVDAV